MRSEFKFILDAIEYENNPFYFGIGGAGDFLLLLSTFYENIERDDADVLFVATSPNQIQQFSKLFPMVRKYWIYPRSAFSPTKNTWDIITYRNCKGTGATPKEFDYINDWIECGKSNVFDYYGVKKLTEKTFTKYTSVFGHITVQLVGGKDNNRVSRIPNEVVKNLAEFYRKYKKLKTYLIGSTKDRENIGIIEGANWITTFEESIHMLLGSYRHYSVNSWSKTFTGLMDIPTVIYPSKYLAPPEKVYGHHKDPADYVFLDGWGFHMSKDWSKDEK